MTKIKKSPGIRWLLKMAWRDGKASSRKLSLFMASIVMGIAAVVAIQSFGENLKQNISLQSKSLMGADYRIDMNNPPGERLLKVMDSLGGADAAEISFSSMVSFPNGSTKLVQVRGIESGFPFYGKIETRPEEAAIGFQQQKGALVDATVMLQGGLNPGDSIKLGELRLPIIGSLISIPGSTAIFSSVAPPVVIPYDLVEETGLVQTGSRIGYDFYFYAPEKDMEQLDEQLDPVLDALDADLDTNTSTSERMGRRYENFGKFLNLVAFIALLLGCVGIASAIHIYIREKLPSIAILKCLGASRKQSFMIYLLQIAGIGLLGGVLGTIGGILLQELFPLLLKGLLPVEVELGISPRVVVMGLLLGLLMSILFALYPLIGTLYVSPLEALRVREGSRSGTWKAKLLVMAAIFFFILLFSYWLLKDWRYSLGFLAGIIVTFSILAAVAQTFMSLIRRHFPSQWSFPARQSLLNLFRPQNQTLVLVLAIGVGTFLISTLYFTKDLLLAQGQMESQADSPNMILLDVQREQQQDVINAITQKELPLINNIPIVTMRVHSINDRSVNELRNDSLSQINRWVLHHEFRVTYRDSLLSSEISEAGAWPAEKDKGGKIPISISSDFAEDAQVGLNDELVFNVQGVLMNTYVKNIRTLDWSRMQMNFSLVFPEDVLEKAPQFRVITTKVQDDQTSAVLQQELVRKFPNLTIIDIRQILTVIEGLLNKISWLINFMALFSILTGIIVLLGAVRTSKFQRIRESVLLRTLGAQSRQILKILALEYFFLGVLGAFSGIILSLLSSFLLGWLVFDTAFVPSLFPFFILAPGIILLVMAIGLLNSRSVIKSPPLEVLRAT